MIRTGYLGVGSNVGDRLAHLRAVPDLLEGRAARVTAASPVYETEPVGEVTEQADFLNACLRVETGLDPEALLDACKSIERELGRTAGPRHGPRPIDVDLLLLGDLRLAGNRLTLPHPDLAGRRFVLLPLLDLDPALRLPDGRPLADLLARVEGQRVERFAPFEASGAPPATADPSPR